MEPICLTDIKDIANIIKNKYSRKLKDMVFVFCYKRPDNKYFIFQELSAIPIKKFIYHEDNNSISFSAGWSAWCNPTSLISNADDEKIEAWAEASGQGKLYNSNVRFGSFNNDSWNIERRKENKKNKFDSSFEFRTDRIERVSFYDWGFEVLSSNLSFISLYMRCFPYVLYNSSSERVNSAFMKVKYTGKYFDIIDIYNPNNVYSDIGSLSPFSYWDINEYDPENDEFEKEIANMIKNDNGHQLRNVGQREINLLL